MKKELYIPLIIVALTLVFGIICLMVYLSDGNAYWIKKKLKIGALLLTFTWVASSCEPDVTCYLPAPTYNSVWIDHHGDSLIYSFNDTMFVKIQNPSYDYFSYEIMDKSSISIYSDILQKHNDSINYYEYYFLIFKDEFAPGNYKINFYGETEAIVTKKKIIRTFNFKIN